MANNKVNFGLKNCHYAICTETFNESTGWSTSYGTVKAWPGAVNMSLSAEGEDTDFYADDGVYYTGGTNAGYSGTFESAKVPEDVLEDVFGQQRDNDGLLVEATDDVKKYIAFLFEVDGDSTGTRICLLRCALGRPGIDAETKTNSTEPKTTSVDIKCLPRVDSDHYVKVTADGKTTATTSGAAKYEAFFDAVPVPSFGS